MTPQLVHLIKQMQGTLHINISSIVNRDIFQMLNSEINFYTSRYKKDFPVVHLHSCPPMVYNYPNEQLVYKVYAIISKADSISSSKFFPAFPIRLDDAGKTILLPELETSILLLSNLPK